ncbi:actin cytoskeleton-regulatory complex protein sla1 [Amylocarpus encephaloides]|uniref:Actin cytoskeleton-regulatory complex protein SLA1 n=1 Tax=Amylocarpus encephaloides TaxID=45428 RepID=A0A9P8C3G9_9HELO|nr:actin cytoskeleton-regulatory complex protein sla1 [Amylocarpus encephaloides]
MGFLGVYKAIYDYQPQGESELEIAEGDILYVLEKSGEDDWWRAKKKASGEDDDEPVGLIPNNYIEEAQPAGKARALYDYTRQTDEELSFTEDSQLEVFDTSDPDWILVGLDGEYGFAPANYIELNDEDEPSPAVAAVPAPPSLPRRPPQPVVENEPDSPVSAPSPVNNPAANIAGILTQRAPVTRPPPQYTPDASDDEEPMSPALPPRTVTQTRPSEPIDVRAARSAPVQGVAASPPYNRASHGQIDEEVTHHSPGGFHMYNINEMVTVMGKRKKMPTTLGINSATGVIMIAPEKQRDGPEMQWTAEKMTHYSIEGKHVFMELVRPAKSTDFHAGAKDTAQEIVSALGDLAGAVRASGLSEIIMAGTGQTQKKGQVLYDFHAQGDDEVTVAIGDEVVIIDDTKSEEWWQVKRIRNGKEGVVPSSYIEITGTIEPAPSSSGINAGRSNVDQNRLEEERMAKDALRGARREEDRVEVGPGVRLPERGSSLSARDSSNNPGQQRSNKRDSGRNETSSRSSKSKPDPTKVRTWTDRSKSFSVEAQFLALKDGKINLHKMNGVKIAVPVVKMSVEDLEYVERKTGISLDEDKPLSDIKKQRSRAGDNDRAGNGSPNVGASIERPQKPEYDWFQFFLSCEVPVGLCERYAQAFTKDSMDESLLPDIDASILRNVGIKEGDIIKVMKFLDKKFGRTGGKGVSLGEDDGNSGGIFSGPGGTLRNNTSKGRPAPPVQTNNTINAKAFSQESCDKTLNESVATPLTLVPKPTQKDVARGGFDDDAWDVKPSKQAPQPTPSEPPGPSSVLAPAPQAPALTGAMQELNLLTQPLEPVRAQPTAQPQPQLSQPPPQPQPTAQGPPAVTPSIFAGIGSQQTGLPQQPTGFPNQSQFNQNQNQGIGGIARPRPSPGQFQNSNQTGLTIPPPPGRPLSAPQANQQSAFAPPPLQAQTTGIQNSAGFQNQIAPPGQSMDEIRMMQYAQQQQQMQQNSMGMMNLPQNFNQFNPGAQNGFQYSIQTGIPQQNMTNNGGGPFADPRPQQFSQQQQIPPQPTGFQGSFGSPQQQYPQATGINSFLPPPLQPTQTGAQQQNGFNSSFVPPPMPPMPQQHTMTPLVPQKTGPPPPVRFGMTGDTKKLMPQATGRKANLSQATPQNPFGF